MDDFFDQVLAAAGGPRLYYLALSGALVIPDICSALESPGGEALGSRYKAWFNAHVSPLHISAATGRPALTGEDCYMVRCSFLHQGRVRQPESGYSRILFIEPGASTPNRDHMKIIDDALHVDIHDFCVEVAGAGQGWLARVVGTEPYETNIDAFVRRYPAGLSPYAVGVPLIS